MSRRDTFIHKLSEILVEHHEVPQEKMEGFQEIYDASTMGEFEDFVVQEGLVAPEDMLQALSRYYEVPPFDVRGFFFDHALVSQLPKSFLLRHAVIPLEVDENMLILVAANPSNSNLLSDIGQYVSYDLRFNVGIRNDILDAIEEYSDEAVTEIDEDGENRNEHDDEVVLLIEEDED